MASTILLVLLWGSVAWLGGMILFMLGIAVAAVAPGGPSERVGLWAYGRATRALHYSTVMRRKHGGVDLMRLSPDSEFEALELTIDGEKKDVEDHNNLLSRLHNYPFGLSIERSLALVSARASDVGYHASRAKDAGELTYQQSRRLESGDVLPEFLYNSLVDVPDDQPLVDPADALGVIAYDGRPADPPTAEEFTEESQRGFVDGMSAVQMASLAVPILLGGGMAYLMMGLGQGQLPSPGEVIGLGVWAVGVFG